MHDIGGLLPVYVADPYVGLAVRTFPQLTDAEIEHYLAANIAAVNDVVASAVPKSPLPTIRDRIPVDLLMEVLYPYPTFARGVRGALRRLG